MRNHVRLRLVCGGVGLGVLPAFKLHIFLIDHLFSDLPKWPMFSVFLLCPPVLFVNFLTADAGESRKEWRPLSITNRSGAHNSWEPKRVGLRTE